MKQGKQVCGDVLPPACYGRAYRELGTSGRERTVEAPLTAEQRAQRAAEEKRRSEQERVLNEQRRKDQALLNTYGSEKDIEIMRSRAERDLTAAIQAAQDRIAEIRRLRKKFEDEAEFYRNRQLPVDVAKGCAMPITRSGRRSRSSSPRTGIWRRSG
jgi:vacuolar-type H+-ATPase subunit I/STV1